MKTNAARLSMNDDCYSYRHWCLYSHSQYTHLISESQVIFENNRKFLWEIGAYGLNYDSCDSFDWGMILI